RGDARLALARGHSSYGAARKLYDGHAFERAEEGFRAALSAMDGTPFATAPRVYGIAGMLMNEDFSGTAAAAAALQTREKHAGHPLLGQMCWLQALAELELGRPDEAIAHYRAEAEDFAAAHEGGNAATIQSLIADALESVGDSASA